MQSISFGHTLYTRMYDTFTNDICIDIIMLCLHILNVFDFALYFTHLLIQQTFLFHTHPKTCSAPASDQCSTKK